MDAAVSDEEKSLLKEIDKGIDDMESGKLTAHKDAMKDLFERYNEYVLHHS